ncbi:MAG: hypothetical protein Q3976_05765 [Corynebacterium sp.]|nr:hypothetical protein [Corynebacterium sp.]
MTEFKDWVAEVTGNASSREISRNLETTHVTVSRHINSANVQFAIDLAAAYGANPIPGLVAAGAIKQHHLDEFARQASLESYTDLELAQEIVNRLQQAEQHPYLDTPVDELSLKRSNKTKNTVPAAQYDEEPITKLDWERSEYAAYDTPTDEEMREREGSDFID